ncbi:MAG: hypothetical protein ACRELF_22520, partial [Gemmataceae bacterium]
MRSWSRPALGGWCLVMLLLAGCSRYSSPTPESSKTTPPLPWSAYTKARSQAKPLSFVDVKDVKLDDRSIRVTGP